MSIVNSLRASNKFYDGFAVNYDKMVGGETRLQRAIDQLRPLVEGLEAKNVVDIGCGTGTDSRALASLGCSVIGIDSSPGMIEIALGNLEEKQTNPQFKTDNFNALQSVNDNWADLTICRGNTLPHILSLEELRESIKALTRVTQSGGVTVLGWLNYRLFSDTGRRLIGTSGDPGNAFVRFMDFRPDGLIDFNLIELTHEQKWQAEWHSTTLMPWIPDDVGMLLVESGWHELEICSNIDREEFDLEKSTDIFLFAVKK